MKYSLPIASETLMNRLLREQSVLITPGGHFGIGRYMRIGFGYDIEHTRRGLQRIDPLIEELKEKRRR